MNSTEKWLYEVSCYIYQKTQGDHISKAIAGRAGMRIREYIKANPDTIETSYIRNALIEADINPNLI